MIEQNQPHSAPLMSVFLDQFSKSVTGIHLYMKILEYIDFDSPLFKQSII